MGEDEQRGNVKWLLVMVVGAFLIGAIVYLLNPDYRFAEIIESNQRYFSEVSVENPTRERDDPVQ